MTEISPSWKPQPTSRMCFICGRENPVGLHLQFYEDVENQRLITPITLSDQYQSYPGIAHGGILATILDEVSGRSLNIGRDDEQFWVTAKLEMRYRRPTPTETPLTAVGWVVKRRETAAEVAGEIRLPDGTVTAEIRALIICPPPDALQSWRDEQQHWRVEV
ncbi:MAG: PaaI family thioesterase [Anaerolineae bacterium]|nr:PaaI family thioesterase [Anaerolineae bacterium]